jgi:acyl-coenzyme A thioesterase PaaI-like protein
MRQPATPEHSERALGRGGAISAMLDFAAICARKP